MTSQNHTINDQVFPLLYEFNKPCSVSDFSAWADANKMSIEAKLLFHGAVLIRGVEIDSLQKFQHALTPLANDFINYIDGFSPRTKLSAHVYTSTEYDSDFKITLHNELSFSAVWPSKLFFCCILPAQQGGETPIADGRRIVKKMPPHLLEEFESKGVRYVRNLHAGGGAGPSWQETYETSDKMEVERITSERNIELTWKPDGGVKLVQYRPAVIGHPVTKEKVWFNQVDQFHPVQFSKEIYDMLMLMHQTEEDLPMYGSFGDGSKISNEVITEIIDVVNSEAVPVAWKTGDLLIVDNALVSHGRMPYKGDRKVLVSMSA
jgi:hypothetical protein